MERFSFLYFTKLCFFLALFILSSAALPSHVWAADAHDQALDSLLNLDTQNNGQTAEEEDTALPEDLAEIPDEFIDEAVAFNERCLKDVYLSRNYDCDCLAARYLDTRIAFGPKRSESSILLHIENSCKNPVNIAGAHYEQCMSNGVLYPNVKDLKSYCECYANSFAKAYQLSERNPSVRLRIALHEQASISCQNPELGKRLYPNLPKWKKGSNP